MAANTYKTCSIKSIVCIGIFLEKLYTTFALYFLIILAFRDKIYQKNSRKRLISRHVCIYTK